MFSATLRDDPLESLELRDDGAKSTLVIAPSRGGMATRWSVLGRDVFYLDEGTLRDETKNVRGGNPVLFPQPGKLDGDMFERDGRRGSMKQHGFARNLAWKVTRRGAEGAASAVLRLESSAVTMASFPWEFVAEYTYILRGPLLRIEQRFENTGSDPMPFGAGFHPYFQLQQSYKKNARIGTTATRAFDNVTKRTVPLAVGPATIDLAAKETDLHLVDHGAKPCSLEWAVGSIVVRGSNELTHWVVWSVEGKDFVCVEPWTCPGNALNTGDRLLAVAPGETRTLWVEYEVLR